MICQDSNLMMTEFQALGSTIIFCPARCPAACPSPRRKSSTMLPRGIEP